MSFDADVLVAGGGPIGLATAIEARRLGMTAVVIEPRADAVDKACGEGLMPSALEQLRRLGVEPHGRPFVGIRYLRGSRQVEARFRNGTGRGVRRTSLHTALAQRAQVVGVNRHQDRVTDVRQDHLGVVAAGLRGRWLVGADGLHSTVRREVGLQPAAVPGQAGTARYGLRRHFRVAPWADHVEVHWAPEAEAYVTPVADDLVGVAVLGHARGGGFDRVLDGLPVLRARLRGAEAVTTVRGAGPLRQRALGRRRGRVLLAGDAAGYVDALTGEGLAVGVATACAAAASLAVGRPQDYDAAWSSATRRYRFLTAGLLAVAARPGARSVIVPAAIRWPAGFAHMVNLLA